MKRLLIVVSVLVFISAASFVAGADEQAATSSTPATQSPLAAEGELQQLREPLGKIFQFKLEAGNLKFDRAAWENSAAEIEKKNAAAKETEQLPPGMDPESPAGLRYRARLLQEKATQLERQQRMGALPPFITLFQNVEEQSRHAQRSTSGATGYSTSGKNKIVRRTFAGTTLSGEARTDTDGEMFVIRETAAPSRTLELAIANDSSFRIELADQLGNIMVLRQKPSSFSAVTIIDGKVRLTTSRSFADAYRRNRARLDECVLPVLAQIGMKSPPISGEPESNVPEAASNAPWTDSALFGNGDLQEYRPLLANIFKINVVDGQLKIDREARNPIAEEIKKEFAEAAESAKAQAELARQNPQAAMQLQQALIVRQLLLRSSLAPPPPLVFIFEKIKEQAQRSSRSFGSGGPSGSGSGDRIRWQSSFTGDIASGSLSVANDSENFVLQEAQSARRQLECRADDATIFVRLTDREGDLIVLRQERGGRFTVLAFLGDIALADQRESFAAFVKANRRLVSNDLLPALAQFAIEPIMAPDSFGVQHAVVTSLLSPDEIQAEGKRLIADLNSDDYDTRERVSQSLAARYDSYKDLVHAALDDGSNSPEVQARLNTVGHQQSSALRPADTAAALDLANDPSYLISLLDHAHAEIRPRLIERLEKITGQQFGDHPAAWKQWEAAQLH